MEPFSSTELFKDEPPQPSLWHHINQSDWSHVTVRWRRLKNYCTKTMSSDHDPPPSPLTPHTPRHFKAVVIDTQRVLDQRSGWHIHCQAHYYSSATVPQIVFQVLGISQVTLKAFMSQVCVGPSVCRQWRGSRPAERQTRTWSWGALTADCQKDVTPNRN